MINLISCIDLNNAIGYNGQLLTYKKAADMKRFKELTTGNFTVMGRKSYEEIGKPLPNRTNLVLTKNINADYHPDVCVYDSVSQILFEYEHYADKQVELFVCGGQKVYKEFLPYADQIHLTILHTKFPKADTWFPKFNMSDWKVIEHTDHEADEHNQYPYSFVTYKRK